MVAPVVNASIQNICMFCGLDQTFPYVRDRGYVVNKFRNSRIHFHIPMPRVLDPRADDGCEVFPALDGERELLDQAADRARFPLKQLLPSDADVKKMIRSAVSRLGGLSP